MPRRIITEEELREAAREVLEYELAIFDSYNDYPDHIFHGKFRLDMAALIHEVKRGAVKAAKYSMGFTFYAKQCIAAVLILFTLSCITMPETVLAGYHKLIEVIETVFEDYTEYRYRVNDDGGIEETFKPLKLGYLPEGMEEVWRDYTGTSRDSLYEGKSNDYINNTVLPPGKGQYYIFVPYRRGRLGNSITELYYTVDDLFNDTGNRE